MQKTIQNRRQHRGRRGRPWFGKTGAWLAVMAVAALLAGTATYVRYDQRAFLTHAIALQTQWQQEEQRGLPASRLSAVQAQLTRLERKHYGLFPASWFSDVNGMQGQLMQLQQHAAAIRLQALANSRKNASAALAALEQVESPGSNNAPYQSALSHANTLQSLQKLAHLWSEDAKADAELKQVGGGLVQNAPADVVRLKQQLSSLLGQALGNSQDAQTGNEILAEARQYLKMTPARQLSQHSSMMQQLDQAIDALSEDEDPAASSNQWLFNAGFLSYAKSRQDTISVAVYDADNGQTYLYNSNLDFDTASIVKVTIMADLLYRSKTAGQPLPPPEKKFMKPMIEQSKNPAATRLWNIAGGDAGIQEFLEKVGLTNTTPGVDQQWGLTRTTALDQVDLLRLFAYPNDVLNTTERDYGLNLMEHVISGENWGVSTGVASNATVALKNRWLPYPEKWWVNSVGYVDGDGRDYVIAVLTKGNVSEAYGVQTDDAVSQLVWDELGEN